MAEAVEEQYQEVGEEEYAEEGMEDAHAEAAEGMEEGDNPESVSPGAVRLAPHALLAVCVHAAATSTVKALPGCGCTCSFKDTKHFLDQNARCSGMHVQSRC